MRNIFQRVDDEDSERLQYKNWAKSMFYYTICILILTKIDKRADDFHAIQGSTNAFEKMNH